MISHTHSIIKKISEENDLPFDVVKKAVYTQYEAYKEKIKEAGFEECRIKYIGLLKVRAACYEKS